MFDDSKFFDKGYDNKEVLDKGTFCAKMDQVIDKLDKIISLLSKSNTKAFFGGEAAYLTYDDMMKMYGALQEDLPDSSSELIRALKRTEEMKEMRMEEIKKMENHKDSWEVTTDGKNAWQG